MRTYCLNGCLLTDVLVNGRWLTVKAVALAQATGARQSP